MLPVCSPQRDAQDTLKPRKEPGGERHAAAGGGVKWLVAVLPAAATEFPRFGFRIDVRESHSSAGRRQKAGTGHGRARPAFLSKEGRWFVGTCVQGGAALPCHWAVTVTVTLLVTAARGIFVKQLLLNSSAALEQRGNAKCWRSGVNVW